MSEPRRRTRAAVALALLASALPVAALASDPSPSPGPPRLDLVWVDPTGMAGSVFPRLAAESHAVLGALGAEVDWRAGEKGVVIGPESMAVIAVPTFRRADRHVMGATRRAADGGLAVWVFPDQVAWAIGLDLDVRGSWGMRAEDAFARALARVASHEIIHALGVPRHARDGLMVSTLGREALLAPTIRIDARTLAAVRRRFDGVPLLAADQREGVLEAAPPSSPRRASR